MNCRHCRTPLSLSMIDLGSAPPSNSYLKAENIDAPEKWFPLRVLVCEECWLAQTEDFTSAGELFDSDYAYFSSYSTGWLAHAKTYAAEMVQRYELTRTSLVAEVASNDGYLLQYFQSAGIPCYGIEPTASTALAARARGIRVIGEFFGTSLARRLADKGEQADLIAANNVLAHVPDINDFVSGFAFLLKPDGVATFEFPHLLNLVRGQQFDTIYHEHFSYLSLLAVDRIFTTCGLKIFDVEKIATHGGSLRIYAQRTDTGRRKKTAALAALADEERRAGMGSRDFYRNLQGEAERIKYDLLRFLIEQKVTGKTTVAYGAAAKGNTLLNWAGIRPDLLSKAIDRNPAKQGKFLPGSRIPIASEDELRRTKPDWILILPWNLRDELIEQLSYVREWGARFVTAIPTLDIT